MSQLSIYLPPFSSDYTGVSSVLFDLNCVVIINDADCCTYNYITTDEPRWSNDKKPMYCAAVRTMDAILGYDDKIIKETIEVAQGIKPDFIAMVGTPVPAIIGMDMTGVAREIETKSGYPTLGFDTTGFTYYDRGISSAIMALLKKFATQKLQTKPNSVNILGVTPLDFSINENSASFKKLLEDGGLQIICSFLMQSNLEQIRQSPAAAVNLVVSESGFAVAQYMKEQFDIPYVVATPLGQKHSQEVLKAVKQTLLDKNNRVISGNKPTGTQPSLLVIGDQVIANSIRSAIQMKNKNASITVASFFDLQTELALPGDIFLNNESRLIEVLLSGKYTGLLADPLITQLPDAASLKCYSLPHPAVSSYLYWEKVPLFLGDETEKLLQSCASDFS